MLTTFVIVGYSLYYLLGQPDEHRSHFDITVEPVGDRSPRQVERWLPGWHVRRVILAHEGKHLEKFEIPSGKVRYIYPVQDTGDLIIFLTKDTDKDGQYSEYDNDFVYKLNLQSKNIEEIVDSKLIYNIREILQE